MATALKMYHYIVSLGPLCPDLVAHYVVSNSNSAVRERGASFISVQFSRVWFPVRFMGGFAELIKKVETENVDRLS